MIAISNLLHHGLGIIFINIILTLLTFTHSRFALALIYRKRVPQNSFKQIYLQGLRVDIATIGEIYAIAITIFCLFGLFNLNNNVFLIIFNLILTFSFIFALLNELTTKSFIDEYGVRPNNIYVQYLIYPKTVIKMLLTGHSKEVIFLLTTLIIGFVAVFYFNSTLLITESFLSPLASVICFVIAAIIITFAIRSSLGHRPMNPTMLSFCDDPLVNTIPLNSTYSVIYALTHLNLTKVSKDDLYAKADEANIIKEGCNLSKHTGTLNKGNPFSQKIIPCQNPNLLLKELTPKSKLSTNVVIILEESLGAEFVASLGGRNLCPCLEELKHESWWFNQMYAAGHRSIRGIEAVVGGYPPSPLNSVVKLPQPKFSYANLPNLLKKEGYKTSFIYGGESHFDNMRGYFYQNGVSEIIEQKDYLNPSFVGTWGVSDEDLFAKAHELFTKHYNDHENFCSIIFTSSFHDPFDIPKDKVTLDDTVSDAPKRDLAAKYADYALGKFIKMAKNSDYYKDTIFLIIADHEHRVSTTQRFPIEQFRIPALILGGYIKSYEDNRIVSQIDMLHTLLSLINYDKEIPIIGKNLTQDTENNEGGEALMQYHNYFGYLKDNELTVLGPTKHYFYNLENNKLTQKEQTDNRNDLLNKAIALENLGPYLYEKEILTIK